jgi:hypothetical protein
VVKHKQRLKPLSVISGAGHSNFLSVHGMIETTTRSPASFDLFRKIGFCPAPNICGRLDGRIVQDLGIVVFDKLDPTGEQLVNWKGDFLLVDHASFSRISSSCLTP